MDHDRATPRLDEYLDGELNAAEAASVAAHIADCPACQAALGRRAVVSRALAAGTARTPSASFVASVLDRIAAPAAPAWRTWLTPVLAAAAAAALVLVVAGLRETSAPEPAADVLAVVDTDAVPRFATLDRAASLTPDDVLGTLIEAPQ